MTTLRNSQLASLSVVSNPAAIGLRASQLAVLSAMAPPFAVGLNASQIAVISVIANGQSFQPLGPVVGLGCWTPCANLAYNGS